MQTTTRRRERSGSTKLSTLDVPSRIHRAFVRLDLDTIDDLLRVGWAGIASARLTTEAIGMLVAAIAPHDLGPPPAVEPAGDGDRQRRVWCTSPKCTWTGSRPERSIDHVCPRCRRATVEPTGRGSGRPKGAEPRMVAVRIYLPETVHAALAGVGSVSEQLREAAVKLVAGGRKRHSNG